MPVTRVSTVSLMLTTVSHCLVRTVPLVGRDQTNLVLTSVMLLHRALTASVLLDSLVSGNVMFAHLLSSQLLLSVGSGSES